MIQVKATDRVQRSGGGTNQGQAATRKALGAERWRALCDQTDARCGYTLVNADGEEEPCNRPATSWRWYQDVEHEDVLERACSLHENEGGTRMAGLLAGVDRLTEELDELHEQSFPKSWAGLSAFLAEHYPPDVFPAGEAGLGPELVGAARAIASLHVEVERLESEMVGARETNERLRRERDVLRDAIGPFREIGDCHGCDRENALIVWIDEEQISECIQCNSRERGALWHRWDALRAVVAKVQALCADTDGPPWVVPVFAIERALADAGPQPTPEPECIQCGHWMHRHDTNGCTILAGTAEWGGNSPCPCRVTEGTP